MQVDRTRVYRVKAVADMLDVSPKTVYRAIESGQLDAYKIGTGKGALRIFGEALAVYLDGCGQASANAEVADGRACVVCGHHFADTPAQAAGELGEVA